MLQSASESMALFVSESLGGNDEPAPPGDGPQADEASRHVSKAERKRRGRGIRAAADEEIDAGDVDPDSRNAGTVEGGAGAVVIGSGDSSGRSSRTSDGGSASGPAETGTTAATANLSCRLCREEAGGDLDEPLFRCPCRCSDAFVHRSCLEELLYLPGPEGGPAACSTCGACYPVRRRTKPLWRWFWEDETREDATLFLANLLFSVGNVGVLSMAWLYALFEYRPESRLSQASLASVLFVLTVLWVAFGCVRCCVLSISLAQWRRANTTLQVMFTDKSVAQA
ncbi:hypothetical protein HPB49_021183 [Dermacentor silvarum]|uniref:Uncharacterized protein n=1 Tax=Dermacentor silvarum TaxID=543639 RepID=A0ACB8DG71_DERSI|nr:hypothetical protein HPB49_021183 [Dermacentor silvarum]